jgi:hypothetical protein
MLRVFWLLVSLSFLCAVAAGISIAHTPSDLDETAGYGASPSSLM